eukprot:4150565-Alexandrium_andersonii.AAC.1
MASRLKLLGFWRPTASCQPGNCVATPRGQAQPIPIKTTRDAMRQTRSTGLPHGATFRRRGWRQAWRRCQL